MPASVFVEYVVSLCYHAVDCGRTDACFFFDFPQGSLSKCLSLFNHPFWQIPMSLTVNHQAVPVGSRSQPSRGFDKMELSGKIIKQVSGTQALPDPHIMTLDKTAETVLKLSVIHGQVAVGYLHHTLLRSRA